MVEGIKTCTTCKSAKPLTEFFKSIKNKDGLQAQCKSCQMKVSVRTSAVRRRQRREALVKHMGDKCANCSGVFPSVVYDMHHLDPATKEFQFNNLGSYSWANILKEASKCILLCANCHRLIHNQLQGEQQGNG